MLINSLISYSKYLNVLKCACIVCVQAKFRNTLKVKSFNPIFELGPITLVLLKSEKLTLTHLAA